MGVLEVSSRALICLCNSIKFKNNFLSNDVLSKVRKLLDNSNFVLGNDTICNTPIYGMGWSSFWENIFCDKTEFYANNELKLDGSVVLNFAGYTFVLDR